MALFLSLTLCPALPASADCTAGFPGEFDIKTNLLEDAVGTMSLGAEYRFSPRLSLDIMGAWNPWTFSGHMMYKRWSVSPQLRWWPGEKGHFLGLTLQGGEFNYNKVSLPFGISPSLGDHRYDGWDVGAGVAYGYRHDVSRYFAFEVMLGVGVSYVGYSKYKCHRCGEKLASGNKTFVSPMRTGVNFIYRLGVKPERHVVPEEIPMPKPAAHTADSVRTVEVIVERTVHDTVYVKELVPQKMEDESTRIRHARHALRLSYPSASSRIVTDYGNNGAQLDSLKKFIQSYISDPELNVVSVDVNGYASIEGNAASNLTLSQKRAASLGELIETMYPGLKKILKVRGLGEDWDSLDFDDRESLMEIPDLDLRESKLRKIGDGTLLRNLMDTQIPGTRRVECVINYTIADQPGKK